jgi:ATP-binding cassette subfamily C (CFTR/MRP) protein 1
LLINFTTSGEEVWKGYFYMILLVSSQLLNSILTSQYFYQNMIAGLRIRTVLTSAIFRKSLALSPSARKNLTGKKVRFGSVT